jgi:hypothetical protein
MMTGIVRSQEYVIVGKVLKQNYWNRALLEPQVFWIPM